MPNAAQPLSDFKGDHLSVKMFGAVDDWDTISETGTDNTVAIQAALDALSPGQSLYFPSAGTGIYLITAPLFIPRRVTLYGSDRIHCELRYIGTAPHPAVLNLVGSEGVTIKHLAVMAWGDNPTNFPKTVLMLARTSNDHFGHHMFHQCSFMGNTSVAVVYSIASEENSWRSVNLFGNNGKNNAGTAHHIYYTSSDDDFGICVPAAHNGESNLDIWFIHCHFLQFGLVPSSANDCVYEKMFAGGGDHVYRDCYMSPSARGSVLGWGFRFVADPVYQYSGMNYVVEALRVENAEGMFRLEKGIGFGIVTGLRCSKNTLGINAGYLIYGENGATVHECTFEQNFAPAPAHAVGTSIDKMQFSRIMCDDDQDFEVRTIAAYCYIHIASTISTVTINPSSFNNIVILHDRMTVNGPVQLNAANAFSNQTVTMQLAGDPDTRTIGITKNATNGVNLLFHYDSGGGIKYGLLFTSDNGTPLILAGDNVQVYASDGGGIAGQAQTLVMNKNIVSVSGRLWITATDPTLPWLLLKDPNGAPSSYAMVLQSFGGINYFAVYGAADATSPGMVQCRDIIPFANNTYSLGNPGLYWKEARIKDLFVSGTISGVLPVDDATPIVKGSGDATKLVRIEADGLTTATTRVATMPDRDITLNQIPNLTADSSGLLTCTTSYADVTGASVSLTLTGSYLIIAAFDAFADQPSNGILGRLVVNGVAQTGVVELTIGGLAVTDSIAATVSRQWIYANTGTNTAKLQALKAANAGTAQIKTPGTNITAIFLG